MSEIMYIVLVMDEKRENSMGICDGVNDAVNPTTADTREHPEQNLRFLGQYRERMTILTINMPLKGVALLESRGEIYCGLIHICKKETLRHVSDIFVGSCKTIVCNSERICRAFFCKTGVCIGWVYSSTQDHDKDGNYIKEEIRYQKRVQ